jgi:class 3 adenylate cyclase
MVSCEACGAESGADARFCSGCGASLAMPVGIPPSPIAERRVCSVLFCDLVGFTPTSEQLDPEDVRELLSEYFTVARTIIARYGGLVEKFIGDAVMAVWGTPVATEHDAERAVRAALDVVVAVGHLGDDGHLPTLVARAGVVTGEVAVTLGASGEGMVAGDVVNTAARIQAQASAGTVLVDDATQRLASRVIEFVDAGAHALKGKTGARTLWRATHMLAGRAGGQRVDGLEAAVIGRDAELRRMQHEFHAVDDGDVARLVLVTGPPGVGKSRLGWEFEKYVDGLDGTVWWHRGRCPAYGQGDAFWALAEMLRQRLQIVHDDTPEVATGRLRAALDDLILDPVERTYIGVRIARLLGLEHPDDTGQSLDQDELFCGWRLFLENLAATAPVALIIEDAQYADAALLDFLDHLIDWVRARPILVVVYARDEILAARPAFGSQAGRTIVAARPLGDQPMTDLVRALVPGMPAANTAAVVELAQGIPLFAVETVRALIDRDIVQPFEGVYRLTGAVDRLTVPDSLHGLLAARLDSLSPEMRDVAADAAVLGSNFTVAALTALSRRNHETVIAATAELVRREMFEEADDPSAPVIERRHRFAQEMVRQVAYETLSRRDRKVRHLAAAQHLRTSTINDGEELIDVIAQHYVDAISSVPRAADLADLLEHAIATTSRAGERAARTGAPARATAAFVSAATMSESDGYAGSPSAAALLWERAARAAADDSAYELALEYAARARLQHTALADERAVARTASITALALRHLRRVEEARSEFTPPSWCFASSPTSTPSSRWGD